MTGKALSRLPSFREALVVRAAYSSAPGMSGLCELAVRWRKTQTELWQWNDEWGSECVLKLSKDAAHRELIQAMAGNEQVSATINPFEVEILRDRPPLGSLLALAWAAEFDTQPKALLLAALPFEFLNAMHTSGLEIDGERTRALLGELYEKIRENDLEIEDLLPIQAPNDTSVSAIRAAFRRAIASALRRKRADEAGPRRERRILEAKLAPFQDKIKTIYDNFARIRTPRRYPGGGPLPPAGLSQVRRFVEEFVSSNGCMPSGVHTIPEGPDVFSARSKAFDLDFDAMRLDLPFLLRSDWDANAGRARWFWKDPKTPAVSNVFESEAAAIAAWKDGKVVLHEPT